ncbi:MAG: hypothetical protein HC877_23735 [Thioploca sp.]|nr:hypothetical protein [Thioploca sp.]
MDSVDNDNNSSDLCEEIAKKINELINRNKRDFGNSGTHGLRYRFEEQINGANGPGTPEWDSHERVIKEQQKGLRKKLREYEENGCGDPPPGAWKWASKEVPSAKQWKNPALNMQAIETGAKVVAGVGLGYVIYRGIRFLPSLFPPLWPTIPANLAIP